MRDLPPGWATTTLGEIAETSLGKMLDRAKHTGRDLRPYVRNVNVQWDRIDLDDILAMDIPAAQAEHYRLRPGDLLVCEGGEIGRCAIWQDQIGYMAYQKALHRVRPYGGIDPRYLRYWLEHLAKQGTLAAFSTGSTIKHLPQEQLRQLPLILPPITEQRRIVAALEDYLSLLDHCRSLLAGVARKAAALRTAYQNQLEAEASSYPEVHLGELLAEPLRNGHSARVTNSGGGVRSLTLTAVTKAQFIDKHTKLTAADPAHTKDLWLQRGDILIQRSNTPELVGTVAMYDGENDWAIFPDLLIRIRLQSRVVPEYATTMLSTRRARHYFQRSAKGLAGSMPKIDQATVAAAKIPLPPTSLQHEVVERMRSLTAISNRLMRDSESLERRAAALRRSLLSHAFAGQLTSQDSGDEPASVLLGRIRAERAAAPTRSTRSTRTRKELASPVTTVTTDDFRQGELPL